MNKQSAQFYPMVPLLRAAEISSQEGKAAAIGAFNVNFYTQAEGILEGLRRGNAPGIIQASRGANKFQGGPDKIAGMVKHAIENTHHQLPVALHLDHGDDEKAHECVDNGYSSVMIDASKLDLEENIRATKTIVEYAHPKGVSVEGEYGKLAGVEEDVIHEKTTYADPYLVPYFFHETGTDALAIAYGTSHGPNKGKGLENLAIHVVDESYRGMKAYGQNNDHFLVGHGSSTVPQDIVAEINQYGGGVKNAAGIPMNKIQEVIASGIRKVNIDTDLRLGITATFRKYFVDHSHIEDNSPEVLQPIKKVLDENPEVIDPRDYLKVIDVELLRNDPAGSVLEEVMILVKERIAAHVEMLVRKFGCAGLGNKVERVSLEEMAKIYQ
ncbi:class II fructose-bisphosphate aldolase [bacterium]|nr:class II fructose-bisphosphate aldolase [bacterium]RQV93725.1 MAG: fructose-bisphosphate aldolase [bacterium]